MHALFETRTASHTTTWSTTQAFTALAHPSKDHEGGLEDPPSCSDCHVAAVGAGAGEEAVVAATLGEGLAHPVPSGDPCHRHVAAARREEAHASWGLPLEAHPVVADLAAQRTAAGNHLEGHGRGAAQGPSLRQRPLLHRHREARNREHALLHAATCAALPRAEPLIHPRSRKRPPIRRHPHPASAVANTAAGETRRDGCRGAPALRTIGARGNANDG